MTPLDLCTEPVFINCDNPYTKTSNPLQDTASQLQRSLKLSEPSVWTRPQVAARRVLETVTVTGENGSELTIDENNRICAFKDAVGRRFSFGYEAIDGTLNRFTDSRGEWQREQSRDGSYLNIWFNSQTQERWYGRVSIEKTGVSLTGGNVRTHHSSCGTRTIDRLVEGRVLARTREDAHGNSSEEDIAKGAVSYKFADGRTALRNLIDGSLLGYDAQGNLNVMRDAAGKRFEFANYCEAGKPQTVINERGTWNLVQDGMWLNEQNGRLWSGSVDVDPQGSYTYTDATGKISSRFCNGYTVQTYCGIRAVTDKNGNTNRQYVDGQEFLEPPITALARVNFVSGVAKSCLLRIDAGQVQNAQTSTSEKFAAITLQPHSPVSAFQDGIVVFSTRCPEALDQRNHAVIGLSERDLACIWSLQNVGLGSDMVIVQCRDNSGNAPVYELYAGLEQANVVVGDRVKTGQPIGRLADDATLNFSARSESLSGPALEVSTSHV